MTAMGTGRGALRRKVAAFGAICLAAVLSGAATKELPPAIQDPNVSVRRVHAGDHVELVVENRKACSITLLLSITPRNVTVSRLEPETATYPPRSRTVAARLAAADLSQPSRLRFKFFWMKGDMNARHDERALYVLPFRSGTSHRVLQGYDSPWSHKDVDRYAVDFVMPEGTLVCAARAGVVVDFKKSSDQGGTGVKKDCPANFVSILHDDGTIGEYLHLQHNGVLVTVGRRVTAGSPIARSGNTGYSTQPHLHFGVYSAIDGTHLQSHPVTFAAREGTITEPVPGAVYTAR